MSDQVDTDLYQDVGALKADVATLDKRTLAMDEKLDRVIAHIEREKGAKRAWLGVGAALGGLAGSIAAAVVGWWLK